MQRDHDPPWGHPAGRARPGFTTRTAGLRVHPHHYSRMPQGAAFRHSTDTETSTAVPQVPTARASTVMQGKALRHHGQVVLASQGPSAGLFHRIGHPPVLSPEKGTTRASNKNFSGPLLASHHPSKFAPLQRLAGQLRQTPPISSSSSSEEGLSPASRQPHVSPPSHSESTEATVAQQEPWGPTVSRKSPKGLPLQPHPVLSPVEGGRTSPSICSPNAAFQAGPALPAFSLGDPSQGVFTAAVQCSVPGTGQHPPEYSLSLTKRWRAGCSTCPCPARGQGAWR